MTHTVPEDMSNPPLRVHRQREDATTAGDRPIPANSGPSGRMRQLETDLLNVSERLAKFESNLQAAAESEKEFCTFVQTFTNSMDSSILKHIEEDRRLTRLIAEDTRRTQEAKDEYDALASRFDNDMRAPSPTKIREFLRTVSVYIGIVLSLVFMAPLHAIWFVISKVLAGLGLITRPVFVARKRKANEKAEASRRKATKRDGSRRSPHRQGHKNGDAASPSSKSANKASPGEQQHNESTSPSATASRAHRMRGRAGSSTKTATNAKHGSDAFEHSSSEAGRHEDDVDAKLMTDLDEFVDALSAVESRSASNSQRTNQVDDDDSDGDDGESVRPGWAIPTNSSGTFPEYSTFPSAEFWNISADDIKLEMLRDSVSRPDASSSGPGLE